MLLRDGHQPGSRANGCRGAAASNSARRPVRWGPWGRWPIGKPYAAPTRRRICPPRPQGRAEPSCLGGSSSVPNGTRWHHFGPFSSVCTPRNWVGQRAAGGRDREGQGDVPFRMAGVGTTRLRGMPVDRRLGAGMRCVDLGSVDVLGFGEDRTPGSPPSRNQPARAREARFGRGLTLRHLRYQIYYVRQT